MKVNELVLISIVDMEKVEPAVNWHLPSEKPKIAQALECARMKSASHLILNPGVLTFALSWKDYNTYKK